MISIHNPFAFRPIPTHTFPQRSNGPETPKQQSGRMVNDDNEQVEVL